MQGSLTPSPPSTRLASKPTRKHPVAKPAAHKTHVATPKHKLPCGQGRQPQEALTGMLARVRGPATGEADQILTTKLAGGPSTRPPVFV